MKHQWRFSAAVAVLACGGTADAASADDNGERQRKDTDADYTPLREFEPGAELFRVHRRAFRQAGETVRPSIRIWDSKWSPRRARAVRRTSGRPRAKGPTSTAPRRRRNRRQHRCRCEQWRQHPLRGHHRDRRGARHRPLQEKHAVRLSLRVHWSSSRCPSRTGERSGGRVRLSRQPCP